MAVALVEVYLRINDSKISRPSASFMVNGIQLKFKNHLIFEAPNKYFMSGKLKRAYIHTFTFPVDKIN